MKRNRFFILLALIGLSTTMMFTSCKRQLKRVDIRTIESTEEQNSMWCYFYNGYYLNQPLKARQNFLLDNEHYQKDVKRDSQKQYLGEEFLGYGDFIVLKGDRVIPIEIVRCSKYKPTNTVFDAPFSKKDDWIETKFQVVRDGKVVGEGWQDFRLVRSSYYLAPFTWTVMFGNWKSWIAWFIILGGLIVLVHRLMLRSHRRDLERNNEPDETKGMYLPYIYTAFSFLLGIVFIYLYFCPSEVASLYFNPNIFAHWSEYATMVKAFPFLLILFIATAVGMFFEMNNKMPDIGAVILHFIGWLAMGFFVMGAILFLAISLYALFLFLLPLAILLFGGSISGSGGGGGGGKKETFLDHAFGNTKADEEFRKKVREQQRRERENQ